MMTLINQSTVLFENSDLLHINDSDSKKLSDENGNSYNFNRDIDKLCFKNALSRFLKTGIKEDAYDIYFCFNEIFHTFGKNEDSINTLLSLLYDHESKAASLLMKHRDHYSHSVYVFALGLAIFSNNKKMRDAFKNVYGQENMCYNFLKYWGTCSLFHDIGYPYEITFNQILEYGKKTGDEDISKNMSISYTNFDEFVSLSEEERQKCQNFVKDYKDFDVNTLFSCYIYDNFGALTDDEEKDISTIYHHLKNRIVNPEKFMDHAYFSAVIYLKKLLKVENFILDKITLDSIMAIMLHNSFYKCTYKDEIRKNKDYRQIDLHTHPLAYLLMLCDELQCWDRTAYGENTKKQLYPWDMDIDVNDTSISCTYYFKEVIDEAIKTKQQTIKDDIDKRVVATSQLCKITIDAEYKPKTKCVYKYLSDSKFIDLQKMASAINASYNEDCANDNIENMNKQFDELTLEYKLSNIAQAKHYIQHIENINCFFSDKNLDLEPVASFTEDEKEYLARCEHIRWANEKVTMGWKYGTYKNRAERERKRLHKDLLPYDYLNFGEQKKDWYVIDNMIKQLDKFGIKIYRTAKAKKDYVLGCVGHRDLSRIENFDEQTVRKNIRKYLKALSADKNLVLYCGFAQGSDLIFAEEAYNCNTDVIAVLPCPWEEYIKEHDDKAKFMQLFSQVKQVILRPNVVARYKEVSRYISSKADEMLVLWDGKKIPFEDENNNPINIGGTYYTVQNLLNTNTVVTHFGKSPEKDFQTDN